MKKNSITRLEGTKRQIRRMAAQQRLTVGLDLGDRASRYCVLDEAGAKASEGELPTSKTGLDSMFAKMGSCRIALEVGTHSPWVSRLLESLGHEVMVANARRVRAIGDSNRKNDKMDARLLARLARVDPALLYPIRHRGERAQQHLAMIRARAALVDGRTGLINTVRGQTKSFGERLGACDADQMGVEKMEKLSAGKRCHES